jgi:hypothetical protein
MRVTEFAPSSRGSCSNRCCPIGCGSTTTSPYCPGALRPALAHEPDHTGIDKKSVPPCRRGTHPAERLRLYYPLAAGLVDLVAGEYDVALASGYAAPLGAVTLGRGGRVGGGAGRAARER